MTAPRTRHLRLIAADIADEHAAETVSGAADEIERLNSISEILEANAHVQAQLLADTARERDALREQLVNARRALEAMLGEFGTREHHDCVCGACNIVRNARAALIDDQGSEK